MKNNLKATQAIKQSFLLVLTVPQKSKPDGSILKNASNLISEIAKRSMLDIRKRIVKLGSVEILLKLATTDSM